MLGIFKMKLWERQKMESVLDGNGLRMKVEKSQKVQLLFGKITYVQRWILVVFVANEMSWGDVGDGVAYD